MAGKRMSGQGTYAAAQRGGIYTWIITICSQANPWVGGADNNVAFGLRCVRAKDFRPDPVPSWPLEESASQGTSQLRMLGRL